MISVPSSPAAPAQREQPAPEFLLMAAAVQASLEPKAVEKTDGKR